MNSALDILDISDFHCNQKLQECYLNDHGIKLYPPDPLELYWGKGAWGEGGKHYGGGVIAPGHATREYATALCFYTYYLWRNKMGSFPEISEVASKLASKYVKHKWETNHD